MENVSMTALLDSLKTKHFKNVKNVIILAKAVMTTTIVPNVSLDLKRILMIFANLFVKQEKNISMENVSVVKTKDVEFALILKVVFLVNRIRF
jgi:flagellar motor component MotA